MSTENLVAVTHQAALSRALRGVEAHHKIARHRLMLQASDLFRLGDALAALASIAYERGGALADAAGDHGTAIAKLRHRCRHLEADAERIARQRRRKPNQPSKTREAA